MFSVVIPLYNKEKSVRTAIQSVLAQTITDFELLIINDGSTDKSRSVVASVNDSRIRIIDKLNGGVSSARNVGALAAAYEFIAFIDADDHWEPDFLETIKGLTIEYPLAGVYTTAYSCRFNDRILHTFGASNRGIIEDFFLQVYKAPVMHASSVCIRKATFAHNGYFDERISRGEDYDMWARLARKSCIAASPESKVWYRLDAENRAMSTLPVPSKLWLYYASEKETTKDQMNYYKRFIHRQVLAYLMHGKYAWAKQLASRNWKIAPWYSYLYIPDYIQLRQLKTLWNLMSVRLKQNSAAIFMWAISSFIYNLACY